MESPILQDMMHGRTSPVERGDLSSSGYLTVSTAERTTSPASSNEKDSFGYLDLLNGLPSMQSRGKLACEGTEEDQMWESETVLTQSLLRDDEVKDVKAITNYAILLHGYHGDLAKASVLLQEVLEMEPEDIDALNAYGTVLHDVCQKVRALQDKSERDLILDRGIRWSRSDRKAEHPNCYDALTKMQHKVWLAFKCVCQHSSLLIELLFRHPFLRVTVARILVSMQLTPEAMKGCIQLGKRLQLFESRVAAEDLAARGRAKFGGGSA